MVNHSFKIEFFNKVANVELVTLRKNEFVDNHVSKYFMSFKKTDCFCQSLNSIQIILETYTKYIKVSKVETVADMPTFPKPKEEDFPRLASPEGPPWLGLRGRKF